LVMEGEVVLHPFDCISDFVFFETEIKKADKYGVTRDSWYLDEGGIRKVMSEVRKIGEYFEK